MAPVPPDRLDGVVAFVRVAERRSFRAAAADLNVSPSAISQTIRALEARIGAPLLTRSTRAVGLTEAGERFLAHARPALTGMADAFDAARALGEEVTGLLRLNVPRAMISPLIEPLLADFMAQHPRLQVEVVADDAMISIIDEGYDAGVRLGEYLEADMIAVRLSPPFRFHVYGSPAYFRAHGRPERPADLEDHRCIRFRRPSGSQYRWEFVEDGRLTETPVDGPLIVNHQPLGLAMAAQGFGLFYTAAPLAWEQVARGELEPVLTAYAPETPGVFLYYPGRNQALPRLKAFADFARRRLPILEALGQSAAAMPPST
jgi:DNA-binding transcriptional LysR family regulator